MMKNGKTNSKKSFEWVLILLSFYIIFSLSKSLWSFFGVSSHLEKTKKELLLEKESRRNIEAKIMEATSEAYVEKVARNELNMQKEGDIVVVILNDEKSFLNINSQDEKEDGKNKVNWQKWWDLIN